MEHNLNQTCFMILLHIERANGTANVSASHGGTQFSYWCQSIA